MNTNPSIPITAEDVAQHLTSYPLGALRAIQPLTSGSVQTNFLVVTSSGRALCQLYTNRSTAAVNFELEVLTFLSTHHFPAPRPLQNKRGKFISQLKGVPCMLFEFIEGKHVAHPSIEQKKGLIHTVARLNRLTTGFRPLHTPARWNYTIPFCQRLANEQAARLGTPNAAAKRIWYAKTLDGIELPSTLPQGICHTDFHHTNMLYQGETLSGLLDFDDANYTCLVLDLAFLIDPFKAAYKHASWSEFPVGVDLFEFEEARWIVERYAQERPLTSLEKRHSFDAFKLTVMLDCLWFYARGEAAAFYERHKIDCLNALGRAGWIDALF